MNTNFLRHGAVAATATLLLVTFSCSSPSTEAERAAEPEVTENTPLHIAPGDDARAMIDRAEAVGDKLEAGMQNREQQVLDP